MGPGRRGATLGRRCGGLGGAGREDGQILPGLVMLLLAILALGDHRLPDRQGGDPALPGADGGDAAALAGAREIKRQLEVQWVDVRHHRHRRDRQPSSGPGCAEYAERNDGRLDPELAPKIEGVDVACGSSAATAGGDAESNDSEQRPRRGRARARRSPSA